MAAGNRLGELLVREKLISLQQLRQAQEEQRKSGQNLGYALAKLGYISDGEITNFLSAQYRVPAVNLDVASLQMRERRHCTTLDSDDTGALDVVLWMGGLSHG